MGVLLGVNGFKDKRIVYFSNELNLPSVGDFGDCYFIINDNNSYLKYWNGAFFANASDREDGIKAVSDYFRDYYAKFADIDTSKYLGRCREIMVIEDENNDGDTAKYFFDGSALISNLSKTILSRIEALEYVPIVIYSFINNVNNVEKGSTVTNITFSYTFNKSANAININNGIGVVTGGSITKTVSLTTNTTYTLTVSDGRNAVTANSAVTFLNKAYWGTNANGTLTNAEVLGLANNTLATTRNRTLTLNGNGEYIYYCYPASFGDASFSISGLASTAWTKSVQHVTNSFGNVTSYNVYRTNNIQNGTGIQIQIN